MSFYHLQVIGRVMRQIKRLRRGLKETSMWTLVTQRPEIEALLFPHETMGNISPEVHFNYSGLKALHV